jgi:hypothetical protein
MNLHLAEIAMQIAPGARGASRRSGRLASLGQPESSIQYHADPAAGEMPGVESAGECLAVHARQLAIEQDLQIP